MLFPTYVAIMLSFMGTEFDLCEAVVIFKSFCNSPPQVKIVAIHIIVDCAMRQEKKLLYHFFERNFVCSKTVKNSSACPTLTSLSS